MTAQKIKFFLVGDSKVGKTKLLKRFIGEFYQEEYHETTYTDSRRIEKSFNGENYLLCFWDYVGSERFKPYAKKMFLTNYNVALFVYDISNKKSFENITDWMEYCQNKAGKISKMVLVGNKCDIEEDKRQVSTDEGKKFADDNGMLFYETSAKNNINVKAVFEENAEEISKIMKENNYQLENDDKKIKKTKKTGCCCCH